MFGCKGYVHIPKEKRRKLDEKAVLLIFVGYSAETKAYRMLDTKINKITISRDVRFIKHELNCKKQEDLQEDSWEEEIRTKEENISEEKEMTYSEEAERFIKDKFEDARA